MEPISDDERREVSRFAQEITAARDYLLDHPERMFEVAAALQQITSLMLANSRYPEWLERR